MDVEEELKQRLIAKLREEMNKCERCGGHVEQCILYGCLKAPKQPLGIMKAKVKR